MPREPLPYLTPERALIFRLTHIDNLPWILEHGLVCQTSPLKDPGFRAIGSGDVIAKRLTHAVSLDPGGVLADYVPFYFTPLSVMMLNVVTGYRDIGRVSASDLVVLASSLLTAEQARVRFLFTDRHALLSTARFSASLSELATLVDWKCLQMRDFQHDPEDPGKKERYQAEALIHGRLPVHLLTGLACSSPARVEGLQAMAEGHGLDVNVIARPEWFFQ